MTEQALVTIGMPCYRRAGQLRLALASVLGQTYRNLRILVHENPSDTCEVAEVVAEMAGDDPRVSYLRHETNIGAHANFGGLLQVAESPYFMWLADDDRLSETFVEDMVRLLEADPEAGSAFGGVVLEDASGRTVAELADFSAFAERDRRERLLRYLGEPELLGKASLIYGLHRTDYCREAWSRHLQDYEANGLSAWGLDLVFVFALLASRPWAFTSASHLIKTMPKISKRGYWHAFPQDFGPPAISFEPFVSDLCAVSPDDEVRLLVKEAMQTRRRHEALVGRWRRPLMRIVERGILPASFTRSRILRR